MKTLIEIFGQGKDLDTLQMSSRGFVVFFIAFGLIRISGRRSFGIHTPLDNIITIALGAILSRAVVGASSFIPVIVTCTVIVCLHRFIGWLIVRYPATGRFFEGDKMILYKDGAFIDQNLRHHQVCREDVMQGVRKSALTEDLNKIEHIYIERNGGISIIKKE